MRTDCFLRRQAQGRHILHLPKSQVDGDGHHQYIQYTSITNENYSVWTTSYLCSWCSSCSRLWAERLKAFSTETNEMISEETDKRNDLSANNIIPQGQNILCAFSCADSYGFVDGNCMPIPQDTYRQAIPQTQVAV